MNFQLIVTHLIRLVGNYLKSSFLQGIFLFAPVAQMHQRQWMGIKGLISETISIQ